MEAELFILMATVLVAATLQSATGIGFGAIAGPILLIYLNDSSAIQVSIALNLVIALLLTPTVRKQIDRPLLKNMLIGIAAGSPLGLFIFLNIDVVVLKVGAGIGVLLTLLLVLSSARLRAASSHRNAGMPRQLAIGVVAGVMAVCLAMPGPVPAAWMVINGYTKETIRATILAMFVVSYAIAALLQSGLVGIGSQVFSLSITLLPATVAGIVLGHYLQRKISERGYQRILITALGATTILLFSSLT